MCKRDRPLEENVKGAETLAYLIEVDPALQVQASITDHLMTTLQHYLHYTDVKKVSSCDKKANKSFFFFFSPFSVLYLQLPIVLLENQ